MSLGLQTLQSCLLQQRRGRRALICPCPSEHNLQRAAAPSCITLDAGRTKPTYDYGKIPSFPSDKHSAMPLKSSLGISISKAASEQNIHFKKGPTYSIFPSLLKL